MAGKNKQYSIAGQRAGKRPTGPVRLGDALKEIMEGRIGPQQVRFEKVSGAWRNLLPTELYEHCRIAGISAGCLEVIVDSPSHLYELKLSASELLFELQQRCPRVRIKKIKFTLG
ncbi:MAG: DciA family protein [Planctomycetota bacterium]|jgi:hypothetical protein